MACAHVLNLADPATLPHDRVLTYWTVGNCTILLKNWEVVHGSFGNLRLIGFALNSKSRRMVPIRNLLGIIAETGKSAQFREMQGMGCILWPLEKAHCLGRFLSQETCILWTKQQTNTSLKWSGILQWRQGSRQQVTILATGCRSMDAKMMRDRKAKPRKEAWTGCFLGML